MIYLRTILPRILSIVKPIPHFPHHKFIIKGIYRIFNIKSSSFFISDELLYLINKEENHENRELGYLY